MSLEPQKRCSTCGLMLALSRFSRERRASDGRRAACKSCISTSGVAYRARTKAEKAEYDRKYRKLNAALRRAQKQRWAMENAERLAAKRKSQAAHRAATFALWAEKNKARLQEIRKAKYWADPVTARAKVAESRKRHPETARIYRKKNAAQLNADWHRRRAQARAGGNHTPKQVKGLLAKQRYRCAICRNDIRRARHKDHIVPLSGGGSNDIHNIQLLCPGCNLRKHAKDPIAFMQSMGFLL